MIKKISILIFFFGIFTWLIPAIDFRNLDSNIIIIFYAYHLIMFTLYILQFIKMIKNKRSNAYEVAILYLSYIGIILSYVAVCVLSLIQGVEIVVKITPLILKAVAVLSLITYRYSQYEISELDKKRKIEKKNKKNKASQIKETKSNKRWIYRILYKDFIYNFKSYSIFILSAILTSTYVFGFLGNFMIINEMQQANVVSISEGIVADIFSALLVISFITIIIQYYAFKNYINNRMYDFKTLILIGMKKQDIFKCMSIMLGTSLLIAYVIGVILGSIMIYIFKSMYSRYIDNIVIPNLEILPLIILSFVACIVILGFILLVVQDLVLESGVANISDSNMEEKSINFKNILFILPIISILLIVLYANRKLSESKYIYYLFILTIGIFIYYISGNIIDKIKSNKASYYKNIIRLNLMNYKSRSYMKNSVLLFVLVFVMFSSYVFQLSTLYPLESKEMYPYDYVCLGYEEDKKNLEQINEKFDIESEMYEVARLTVPGGEEGGYGNTFKNLPVGHHLGISKSTYEKLTNEDIKLEEKEIMIYYQEDKSNKLHPLDFYITGKSPYIRFGEPSAESLGYGTRESYYDYDFDIVKQERKIILGRLSHLMYENIVVFSDEYFEEKYKSSDGIKYLMTINSQEDNEELEKYMANYESNNKKEQILDRNVKSVYSGKISNESLQGEKVFKLIINIAVIITFVFASIIIVFVHTFGNLSYYKSRYELLSYLGERENILNKNMKKEISTFAMIPIVLALISSLIFNLYIMNIRKFMINEIITVLSINIIAMILIFIIYKISVAIISRLLINQIKNK